MEAVDAIYEKSKVGCTRGRRNICMAPREKYVRLKSLMSKTIQEFQQLLKMILEVKGEID